MGTATRQAARSPARSCRNISYPYGDSNSHCLHLRLSLHRNISYPYGDSNSLKFCLLIRIGYRKHFISLWGQQLRRECRIAGHKHAETFHTLMGTATHTGHLKRTRLDETSHTPTGTATPCTPPKPDCLLKHFIPLWGQQQSVSNSFSIAFAKHFIPLWGQKENRYVQLDISVFTLSARVIHMLRRPYRAPF